MIDGYFGRGIAAICGASQYDTGQRLRLHGIPSPQELGEMDDLLSGELVSVQVQYSCTGDAQTQMRLAEWDGLRGVWMAAIPDSCLTRHEAVNVYVYVGYGAEDGKRRGKTMYTGVMTPMSRPAPEDTVTDEQLARWRALSAEADIVLERADAAMETAASAADTAGTGQETAVAGMESARLAEETANGAMAMLEALEEHLNSLVINTESADGASAVLNGNRLRLSIPHGEKGEAGDRGQDGPTDIGLSFSDGILTVTPMEE